MMKQKDNRKIICIASLLLCFAVLFSYTNIRSFAENIAALAEDGREGLTKDNIEQVLAKHRVQGVTPENATVNLFDYVASKNGAKECDLTSKGSNANGVGNLALPSEWNKGINENRLLLFGDSMVGAGYWNIGAGAGRDWAKKYTNMKGIVESVLAEGYPKINNINRQNPLEGVSGYSTAPIWNMHLAEDENNNDPTDFKSVKALPDKVILNALNAHGDDLYSLAYLFDPKQKLEGNVKRSFENVTGLFQIDEQGYYYYNAFENFAEFKKAEPGTTTRDGKPSDGSFILYDSPAVWRTDGGWQNTNPSNPNEGNFNGPASAGNFFPFNTGRQVFDSIDADGKLKSSDGIKNQSKEDPYTNTVTGEDFYINHHIGMSMTIDFTQPEDGKLNMGSAGKQDMVFQFSGDDDVWVFIDDVLVLDLGGMHSALYGTIDFGTGKVVTGQSWRTNGLLPEGEPGENPGDKLTNLYKCFEDAGKAGDDSNWTTNGDGKKIFATGTRHTLKLFYLERGNYDSTLQMRFNLLPSLYHGIKKVDQNGDPLKGAEFELYAAELKEGKTDIGAENIGKYDVDDYKVKGGLIGTMTTDEEGNASYIKSDGSPFSFLDQYNSDGTLYYIMRESKAPEGYRSLPKDILLRFDSDSSMLIVANRYQSGAYSSFFSSIRETGKITYGQFDTASGDIKPSQSDLGQDSKMSGLIVAVPMLMEKNEAHEQAESNGKWIALYGSNIDGYGAVAPERRTAEAWRKAVLKAALYQASSDTYPQWYIPFNGDKMKLEGTLEELPGRADRYALIKGDNADMKMVYGVIEPSALKRLGITVDTSDTSKDLYNKLKAAINNHIEREKYGSKERSGVSSEEKKENAINSLIELLNISSENFEDRDFSFLNTDQFQREFRSTIYIPNERRELRVWKTDDEGKGINGAEFTLFDDEGNEITKGVTATIEGRDGVLILMPDPPKDDRGKVKQGYADARWMTLDSNDPNHLAHYILKETKAPAGHELNPTKIPVYVGIYSIYADAGTADNGVTVMAGVGKLMQTMTKYAADDMVNITLRDITAFAQKQSSGHFSLSGWQDDKLSGVKPEIGEIIRSMDLHYGINAVIDYGLHDEDGGQNYYPFFTTDVGFLRTRIEQNTDALEGKLFVAHNSNANWDNLRNMDLTNLFTQLNTVVVTNKKTNPETDTGKLCLSKVVTGEDTVLDDYKKNFSFVVSLKDASGAALPGKYYYYGEQRSGYIRDGETLVLRHDEALTILGLPNGTKWKIEETQETDSGWLVAPKFGVISGVIETDVTAYAKFTNYKGILPTGNLTVSKTVEGNGGDKEKEFNFTVTLSDKTIAGAYGDMTFSNGAAAFTLKDGESKTAEDLPADITYTVEEEKYDEEGYVTVSTNKSGTIVKDEIAKAEFTNTREIPTGSLRVSKTVSGDGGEKERVFNFTVTLDDKTITGVYGDMTFDKGVASFTLKHGESKVAENIPANVAYTVEETEADQDGYNTVSTKESGTIEEDQIASAEFTNTKEIPKGSLTVSKIVSGEGGDKGKVFNFTVTLDDKTITGVYGDMTFNKGVASFTLKHGESKTAEKLPAGITYTVEEAEADQDGYATFSVDESGTIIKDETVNAKFTNNKGILPTGNLTVSKTVLGDGGEKQKAFNFTVTLDDKTVTGVYGDMTFNKGAASFTLKHGESKTAEKLPVGVTYTVTEKEADRDGYVTAYTGETGKIVKDETASAEFTNTREISKGSLKVSKIVSGEDGDKQKKFNFTVTLSDKTVTGVYGDMTFDKGTAAFTLKHGESKTAEKLPAGITYTVTEKEADKGGYVTSYTGNTGEILKDKTVSAEFTNTREIPKGNLKVSKIVSGKDGDKGKEFSFTVTLGDKTVTGDYGDMTFSNGVASFKLKHSESKTAVGLPVGITYTVTEKEADKDGYVTSYTGNTGKILKDKTVSAEFTNTREIPKGNLKVSKTVSGADGDKEKEFSFTVTLGDKTVTGVYGGMTFTDGVASFKLKHSESKTAVGLPVGITYTVTEKEADKDGYVTSYTGNTGEILKDKTASAEFTNTREIPKGNLKVSKTVSGADGEKGKEFNFTVTLDNKTITGVYGDMTFNKGEAAFTLKHGQSKIATDLPVGVTYTVTEKEADKDGYVTTHTGETGKIAKDQTVSAEFTNTKGAVPPPQKNTGNIKVSKIVSGNDGDKQKEFNFTVTLGDKTVTGDYGDMTFNSGVAAFTLKHGESKTAVGLPAGVTYTVTEKEADKDGYITVSTGESGTITEDLTVSAEFTNTKETAPPPQENTGSLTVSKTVFGNDEDKQREFNFTVTLGDKTVTGAYGDMIFNSGVAVFTLKHGESKTAAGLPEGIGYTVTESGNDGYTVVSEGETGIIKADVTAQAIFNNHKNGPSDPDVTTKPDEPDITTKPDDPDVTTRPDDPDVTTQPDDPDVTTKPNDPDVTTKSKIDTSIDETPNTGVETNMILWLEFVVLFSITLILTSVLSKRRNKR